MRNVLENLEHTAVGFVHIAKQHHPAKSAVEDHNHGSQNRRRAIAQQLLSKAMKHADHRHAYCPIFDEQRIAQARAGAHEHRRDEVGKKWISEARARKRRIFGWKVLAVNKACNDTQVEGKIAVVIKY